MTSARFYSDIIELFQRHQGARYNDEFPEIIIHNVSAPDNVEGDVSAPLLGHMQQSLKLLQRAGAEIISIPCNSAHIYIREIQRMADVPVLNMIELVGLEIKARGLGRPLLLGTRSTLRSNIYPRFGQDVEYMLPSSAHQDETSEIIMHVCSGTVDDSVRARLLGLLAAYADADCVVLGCTELPLAMGPLAEPKPVINSSKVLAHATFAALLAGATTKSPPCASSSS